VRAHLFRLANKLYKRCYPAYYPLYAAYKAISDKREREVLRQITKPGMDIVDVGANIGNYTRFFAHIIGASGRVHAFEPAPANFSHLHNNVRSLKNVLINNAAVGAHNGTIKLYISEELNVDHRTFDSGDGRASIDVPVICLDSYFEPGQSVDLIKIDVQGYELSVLQGATRVLDENPDVKIVMEFWPYGLIKAGVLPESLIEFILSRGFEIRKTTDPVGHAFDVTKLDATCSDDYCNLLIARSPVVSA
jgi:FkbM family methyltransferase